jgi:hypothetical protein
MKLPLKSVAWVLPLLLTGCFHRASKLPVQQTAPPVVVQPAPAPALEPAPQPQAEIALPAPAPTAEAPKPAEQPQEAAKPPVHHRKPVNRNPQQASSGSPGVSAIGQLTSGGSSVQGRETANSIAATERGLSSIARKLNDSELKTACQIREFLKKAHLALDSGDVDGAHTLAVKAKVLLGELTK